MKTIYTLLDEDRKIKYVGCTSNLDERVRLHWSCRFSKQTVVAEWLRSLDQPPGHDVLQEVSDEQGYAAETYWIKLLRQVPSVDLLNAVDSYADCGHQLSPEARKKISLTHLGKKKTDEHRKNMSLNWGGYRKSSFERLTKEDVLEIRKSQLAPSELAEIFKVTKRTIDRVLRRETWKQI